MISGVLTFLIKIVIKKKKNKRCICYLKLLK